MITRGRGIIDIYLYPSGNLARYDLIGCHLKIIHIYIHLYKQAQRNTTHTRSRPAVGHSGTVKAHEAHMTDGERMYHSLLFTASVTANSRISYIQTLSILFHSRSLSRLDTMDSSVVKNVVDIFSSSVGL